MKNMKKLLCVILAAVTVIGVFAVSASAASSPLKITIKTAKESYNALAAVRVTVTVKNTSSKKVKNVVVFSKSDELITASPNLGKASASEIKAGGSMKYSYVVYLSRYAAANTNTLLRSAMFTQHFLAKPEKFSATNKVSSGSKTSKTKHIDMTAGDAYLTVTAYCGLTAKDYANAKKLVRVSPPKSVTEYTVRAVRGGKRKTAGTSSGKTTGIDPSFKAFWDSYEAFMIKNYKIICNPTAAGLNEYIGLFAQYSDMLDKIDKYTDDDLTDEELEYMLAVEARVAELGVGLALS